MNIETIRQAVAATREALKDEMTFTDVYLFGSYANGTSTPDSDVDLCFVTSDQAPRELEASRQIRLQLYHRLKMPLDILVYKQTSFHQKEFHPSAFEHHISESGVPL